MKVVVRLRYRPAGDELFGSLKLELRRLVIGRSLGQLIAQLFDLLPRRGEPRSRSGQVRLRRRQGRPIRRLRDGHARIVGFELRLRFGHVRPSLVAGHEPIRRVDDREDIARFHELVFDNPDRVQVSADARTHVADVPIHLGVVRVLEVSRVGPISNGTDRRDDPDRHKYDRAP